MPHGPVTGAQLTHGPPTDGEHNMAKQGGVNVTWHPSRGQMSHEPHDGGAAVTLVPPIGANVTCPPVPMEGTK